MSEQVVKLLIGEVPGPETSLSNNFVNICSSKAPSNLKNGYLKPFSATIFEHYQISTRTCLRVNFTIYNKTNKLSLANSKHCMELSLHSCIVSMFNRIPFLRFRFDLWMEDNLRGTDLHFQTTVKQTTV